MASYLCDGRFVSVVVAGTAEALLSYTKFKLVLLFFNIIGEGVVRFCGCCTYHALRIFAVGALAAATRCLVPPPPLRLQCRLSFWAKNAEELSCTVKIVHYYLLTLQSACAQQTAELSPSLDGSALTVRVAKKLPRLSFSFVRNIQKV